MGRAEHTQSPECDIGCNLLQVGNLTQDIKYWGSPENMTASNMKRPAYIVRTADGASDLAGSMVGALASTAIAWQKYGNDSAYVDRLMKGAVELYKDAKKYEGAYTSKFKCAPRPPFVLPLSIALPGPWRIDGIIFLIHMPALPAERGCRRSLVLSIA